MKTLAKFSLFAFLFTVIAMAASELVRPLFVWLGATLSPYVAGASLGPLASAMFADKTQLASALVFALVGWALVGAVLFVLKKLSAVAAWVGAVCVWFLYGAFAIAVMTI